jgi:hypothetical protein
MRLLALQKDLSIDLSKPNDDFVYQSYMNGTINGDIELLAKLFNYLTGGEDHV